MLRNTRPSTALPDWWKQGPSEKLVSQGRRQDQLLSASWHATPAQGSALKQVHGLLEKEMTSVSLHSKDPAVSRRSSDVARQGVFASDPAAKLTSDEPTQEQHSLESTPSKEDPATSNQENRLSKEVQLLKLSEELATDFDSPGTATLPTPEEPTTPPKEENTLSMDMELVKESEALPGEVNGPVTSANLVSKDSPLAEDDCCESIDLDSSFSDDAPKVKPANLSSGTLTLAAEGSDYLGLAPARNAKNLFPALIGGLVAAYALSGLLNQLQYLQLIFF